MKRRHLSLAAVAFCLVGVASAAPLCLTGTLASYQGLGNGGCTIGTDTVASFRILSGITGATPINPVTVKITPSGGTNNPALTFQINPTATANTPTVLEAIFNYSISGAAFTMDMITLSGGSERGDGSNTDSQNFCVGGQFGPDGVTGCSGSASGTLFTADGIQNSDQTPLSGAAFLGITDDFVLDGGTAGSASGGTFADRFTATSAVPEPSAFALTAAGLAFAGLRRLRASRRKS